MTRLSHDARLPVFVYGTLRPGMSNYGLIEHYVDQAKDADIHGYQLHDQGAYPYLIYTGNRQHVVKGTSLTFHPEDYRHVLDMLDLLEGFDTNDPAGSHYERVAAQVMLDGRLVSHWVYRTGMDYAADARTYPVIASGDWIDHQTSLHGRQ